MIESIKLDSRLSYKDVPRITEEEALNILSSNSIIVAFDSSQFVIIWYDTHVEDFYGIYSMDYRKILKRKGLEYYEDTSDLDNLTIDILEECQGPYSGKQICHPDGWMRYFTSPEDIRCKGFRVYDLSPQKVKLNVPT